MSTHVRRSSNETRDALETREALETRDALQKRTTQRTTQGAGATCKMAFAALMTAMTLAPRCDFNRVVAAPVATAAPRPPIMTAAQKARQARAVRVTQTLGRLLRARVSSPGKRLQLVIRPGARADEGYFSEIYVSGRPIQVKKMRISALALRAKQVRIDVPALLNSGKIRTLASQSTLRAVVTENDLRLLMARGRSTRSMNMRVKFLSDRIRVSGDWNWGWFSGPVIAEGRLRLAPGSKVNFDIISLKLNGAEVPSFVKSRFSQKINPLLSYDDIPFQPRFRSLVLKGNQAILSA